MHRCEHYIVYLFFPSQKRPYQRKNKFTLTDYKKKLFSNEKLIIINLVKRKLSNKYKIVNP